MTQFKHSANQALFPLRLHPYQLIADEYDNKTHQKR